MWYFLEASQKYYVKSPAKKTSSILTYGTPVLVKLVGFQERHKRADVWEDDVLRDQP